MRRQRLRPIYYYAHRLYDGTVTAALPMRKPTPHVMKRDQLKIEEDGICKGLLSSGLEYTDCNDDRRFRFLDIIANSLNARRAVRDIALPMLAAVHEEVTAMRAQLDRIERLLSEHVNRPS